MSAREDVVGMLALVPWALARDDATVAQALDTFGIDEPTLHRWVDTLNFCGSPGLGGGDLIEADIIGDRIALRMADELQAPMRLTAPEALLLVLAGESVAAAFAADVPALRTALDKVRTAAGITGDVTVELTDEGSRWLAPLREAIANEVQVRIDHRRRADDDATTRVIEPWQLLALDGTWYVQGYDHLRAALRTFRLDRVVAAEVLTVPWTQSRPRGDLPPPVYDPQPEDIAVELHLAPRARWVADAVRATEVEESEDGSLRVLLHTPATTWLRRILLSAGAGAVVRSPATLADEVREAARRGVARYDAS